MRYRQIRAISGRGLTPEHFRESLRGIAVDEQGVIHAVGDGEVKVFDTDGRLIRGWPTAKPGYCVLVDGLTVYVGESGQIEKFDRTGKPTGLLEDGRLGVVTAVGIHDADVFVGDATNRCIRRYSHSGKWLSDIGKSNNTRGFLIPNGQIDFGVDENGMIQVANPGKHRVERYSPTGELIGSFGKFGMQHAADFGGCCNPTNLALSPQGWVVVTEKAEPRLKIYDGQGRLLAMIGPEAFDPQCKNMDVAVDRKGRVYVADTARLHICVFEPEPETTAPASGRSP